MTLATGDLITPFRFPVQAESMRVWAEILHDPNPLHLDRAAVRRAGLGERLINQGPANLAYVINALHAHFPEAVLESLDVRFIANVFEGDEVEASGKVLRVDEAGDARRITCEVWLRVAGQEVVLAGRAIMRERPATSSAIAGV